MYPSSRPDSGLPERENTARGVATESPLLRLLKVERDGNPLRRYGHVSPHIGKLAPLDGGALDEIAGLAAASLPPASAGPTLVIGTAESALLLAWFLAGRLEGGTDLRFTTRENRHGSNNGLRRTFLEPHSHGPVHSISMPPRRSYPRMVIVEDELTTGATMRNLLLSVRDLSTRCHVVTLSDARPREARACLRDEMRGFGVELSVTDLSLAGEGVSPVRNGHTPPPLDPFPRPVGVLSGAAEELRRRWLALRPECLYAVGECVDVAMAFWGSLSSDERPAFRHVTRSPWLVDGDAITSRLDLSAPRVPRHFLYNWEEEETPRRALLVCERSTAAIARRLHGFLISRGVEAEPVEVPPA